MGHSESLVFKKVMKSIGIFVLAFIVVFIPGIGPILFLFCLYFTGKGLYEAWLESEREFAVTNRDDVPNIIFDPRRNIIRGYEDERSIEERDRHQKKD